MQTNSSRRVVVGAAILNDATQPSKMLAARRMAPKSLAGYWEFPGGKVEPGESNIAGLTREIHEELGVDIDILGLVGAPDERGWLLDNGMYMHVYTAIVTRGEAAPLTEHDQLYWAPLNASDIHALEWIPADRPILDAILEKLTGAEEL